LGSQKYGGEPKSSNNKPPTNERSAKDFVF
jgi:hypothetical protein